jgi:putative copper export protein
MMVRLVDAVQAIAVTLWVGALWTSGLLVAPLLFRMLEDRTLAGDIAGSLFGTTTLIGIVCGACILIVWYFRQRGRTPHHHLLAWLVVAMLALGLIGEYAIAPMLAGLREHAYPQPVMQTAFGGSFARWHMVAGVLYLAQSLLGAGLVISLRFAGNVPAKG